MSLWNLKSIKEEKVPFLSVMEEYAKDLRISSKGTIYAYVAEITHETEGKPEETSKRYSFFISPKIQSQAPEELFYVLQNDKDLPFDKFRFVIWDDINKQWKGENFDLTKDGINAFKMKIDENVNKNKYWRKKIADLLPLDLDYD